MSGGIPVNIFAHTAPGIQPPYLSVNLVADGVEITVRGSQAEGGSQARIIIPAGEFAALQRATIPPAA